MNVVQMIRASQHRYAGLIDTPEGARFVCRRCGLLDREGWARACEGRAETARADAPTGDA